jgi:hypothetical protein
VVALALHIPLFFYPIIRLCGWLELPIWLTALVFIPLGSSQIVSRLYLRHNNFPLGSMGTAGIRFLAWN